MAIAPIAAGMSGISPLSLSTTAKTTGAQAADKGVFGKFADALDNLQQTQGKADTLGVRAATGDLNDVHAYTIAATEASLATELTVAVRNRAVESFNEIMRMPV